MGNWIIENNQFTPVADSTTSANVLPVGVYTPSLDINGWHLIRTGDSFTLPEKIYDLQEHFIEHVMTSLKSLDSNIGILLNGLKGTGKTVTAMILANRINAPIVMVKGSGAHNDDMFEFLSGINSDCIFFFDEFEKNFDQKDSSVLTFLDGAKVSKYRRICLLTTNTKTVNENILGRTSRIRYVLDFTSLSKESARSFIEDNLIDKSHIEEVLNFLEELKFVSIDILKSLITEINIHGFEKFVDFRKFFNVEYATNYYDVEYAYTYESDFPNIMTKIGNRDLADVLLEDLKKHNNRFVPNYPKRKLSDEEFKEFERQEDARKAKFYEENRTIFDSFSTDYFKHSCKFKNLRLGDTIRDDETVVHIDREKEVFFTTDGMRYYLYHVKPSHGKNNYFSFPTMSPFSF